MVFTWGDRGYPAFCFEYKIAFEQYFVADLLAKQFLMFFLKKIYSEFVWKHPKLLCLHLSNYPSQAVLYGAATQNISVLRLEENVDITVHENTWYLNLHQGI